jgi:hypothetical protein
VVVRLYAKRLLKLVDSVYFQVDFKNQCFNILIIGDFFIYECQDIQSKHSHLPVHGAFPVLRRAGARAADPSGGALPICSGEAGAPAECEGEI